MPKQYLFFITLTSLVTSILSQSGGGNDAFQLLNDDNALNRNNVDVQVQDHIVGNSTSFALTNEGRRELMRTSDIMFNKFSGEPRGFKPLIAKHYPVGGEVYDILHEMTTADNVVLRNDRKVKDFNIMKIIDKLGGLPSYPEENEDAEFWDELRAVIDVQEIRKRTPKRELFPRAELWQDYNLNDCAKSVHNEVPGTIQGEYIDALLDERWGYVDFDPDIFPNSCDKNVPWRFFENALTKASKWTLETVMPPTFAVKWLAGRPRPEEVIWAIKKGRINKGVPSDIKKYAKSLKIKSASEFTAYEEGCPNHPSWPAMHAASGSCSMMMGVMLDLNDEQLCQARLTDYAIAYSRTVAGVHYPDDNIMGLNFAQEIIGQALPKYLKERYNADPRKVKRKIKELKYDWNTFDPEDPCPFLRGSHDFCYSDY